MNAALQSEESVKVVFISQNDEKLEEVNLNSPQLIALLNAKQIWIEKFEENLKIKNTVWSYTNQNISLQVY
ncbi:hypothetical protein [Piscibacillus halophilus]|uniref:Uncharacterized protein n=1 Tax=Piscibacillus halophilus TaxID=571933 RepID=A0A1H9JQZ4_9BACI|nr:hypothetical protein [Piscibacillus halophilus]SEQ89198.1 hypothetical protein SAMN05216362_13233 [Piscibacillus halophilus]